VVGIKKNWRLRLDMKKIIIGFIGILISVGFYSSTSLVSAGPFDSAKNQACQGLEFEENTTGECDDAGAGDKLDNTVASVINIASLAVGAISVIMVIIGGMKYVTSQGDSNGITSAKNTIVYAIVGLIIVVLSQIIVRFVIDRSTDAGNSATEQKFDLNNASSPTR
jgi:cytochrome bd-type quinol oxidase subunit 2